MLAELGLALGACALIAAGCDDAGAPADPCADTRCTTAPPPTCEGTVKTVFQALGSCRVDPTGVALCDYPVAQRQDCAQLGNKICQAGQCVDRAIVPCEGVVCDDRPAPDCAGDVARIFKSTGTCNPATPPAGACEYGIEATLDCASSGLVCRAGGCVDATSTPCDPNPCDVAPLGSCSGNVPTSVAAIGTCTPKTVGEVVSAECRYATTEGAACSGATPECYLGVCARTLEAPDQPGELVITEVMKNPTAAGDESEWIELYNPSDAARRLDGCTLSDDGGESHTLAAGVTVPARGYIVLGRSGDRAANGGFVPDYVYAGFTLGNTADEIVVTCGGAVIDRLQWTDQWPSWAGASMSLGRSPPDATSNDFRGAWCDAPARYGDGTNLGSPRRVNPACP